MVIARTAALSAAFVFLSIPAGHAGPCIAAIDRLQAQLDTRVDTTAGAGSASRESTGALLHREPTPESIARAEGALGEGKALQAGLEALGRAREADKAGDENACQHFLEEAQKSLKP
ncbi:hypothetical protein [Microvirga sp. 17 mud 1-3]|uniref:hypothetical protein n=1 Tax=Microvirga sp. 17 mud 1-3 TaxID=2082949 RepID=UPI000D6C2694|nr:hypothetical protein [Microvirga sp. 17 mud 1-3]AWM87399.1 hypothetical protein C4E04_12095 [Microvirga sp. 17 mud 1-3]